MKRNLLFILVAFLPMMASATTMQNTFIYVTGANGWAGSSAELTLNLHNNNPISSWKCDLVLPDGVTFQSIALIPDRRPIGYEAKVTSDENDDGSIAIICDGSDGIGLTGTDGPVATITVSVTKKVPSGIHTITLKDILLYEADGSIFHKDYTEFKWIVMGGSAPFVEEGKVWQYNLAGLRPSGDIWTWNETYSLEGDTAIGSFLCQKLYFSSTEPYPCNHRYKGALYQSGRKVYYIAPNSTTSTLLYDFYCVPGDTLKVNGGKNDYFITEKRLVSYRAKYMTVTEWDQRDLDNHFWRDEGLPPGCYYDMAWIEGIGSRRDLLNEFNEWNIGGATPHLEKCTLNGEVLYDYNDFREDAIVVTGEEETFRKNYPEGTKWTEIRLDTLKYDSWYSKVGDEWMPNFETVEYYVRHDGYDWWYSIDNFMSVDYVYTSGPNWTDSLALTISEEHTESDTYINASIEIRNDNEWREYVGFGQAYQFNWLVGKELYYQDMTVDELVYPDMVSEEHHSRKKIIGYDEPDYPSGSRHPYGTIEEIKEGDFGGVRPLKYVDLDGVRIIQGIGVTEWKDGECLFGPLKLYASSYYFQGTPPERHYRSMLVHFERDGEVLYNIWPEKKRVATTTFNGVNYFLYLDTHEAVLTEGNNYSGELDIPSEVIYSGHAYTVTSMFLHAFVDCRDLTKVRIPKTLKNILHSYPWDPDDENPPTGMANPVYMNPFQGCTALESIEVDEENPSLKSVDGVLFSQDGVGQYYYKTDTFYGTGLYCYPKGKQQEAYTIPDGLEWISEEAFSHNQYLTTLTMPSSLKQICSYVFAGCNNLKDIYCYAEPVPVAFNNAFEDFPVASATLHVPAGSVEKYKATSPWNKFGNIVEMTTSGKILPFVQDGKVWTYEASNFIYEWEETNSLEGDTVINSRNCLKLYYSCQHFNENHLYKGAMFEEGGNVYIIVPGSTTPVLLYDFSSEPGTIFKVGEFEIKIKEKKLVKYRGEYLRVFDYCITENEYYPFGGIEGLGFFGGYLTCLLEGGVPGSTGGIRYLKTCTLNGKVIYEDYDFNTSAQIVKEDEIYFTKDQMATIILPTAPDASKGKYYRLDRCEDGKIIFEQEKQPQARVPYIIVPREDFSIDPSTLDLKGLTQDAVSIDGISFIGSYKSEELEEKEGWYIDIIDITPDCQAEEGKAFLIGALRAYLLVNWDDPINHPGSKGPEEKLEIVLKDKGTNIEEIKNEKIKIKNEGSLYDFQGRRLSGKPAQGIYIEDGKKLLVK